MSHFYEYSIWLIVYESWISIDSMEAVEKQRQVNFGIGETSTQIGILQVRQTLCCINNVP